MGGVRIFWEWEKQSRRRADKLFFLRFQGEMNAPDAQVAEGLRQVSEPGRDRKDGPLGHSGDSAQCKRSRAPVRACTRTQSCLAQGRACQAGNLARLETGMTVGRRGVVSGKGGESGQRPGSVASGLGEREGGWQRE